MKECAFCPHSASLSAEHILGRWTSELFPYENTLRFTKKGQVTEWKSSEIDWKARVVCERCNNTWMSDIEAKHAKPVITPLIEGNANMTITPQIGRSIALLAFKTAVVLDHAHHRGNPFFSQRIRYTFRQDQSMPAGTHMWMCGVFDHRQRIYIRAAYLSGKLVAAYPVKGYVCTCAIGHFVFQVATFKHFGRTPLYALPGFDHLAVPFWPGIPPNLTWPFPANLEGRSDVRRFAARWDRVGTDFHFRN